MDQIHQNLQILSQFRKPQFLKKAIQFLLTISIFTFLFSYSSWLPFLLHFFNLYFSTVSFELFSYILDRNYIFLLCNGILVFLAINSNFIGSSSYWTDLHDDFFNKNGDGLQSVSELSEMKASVLEKEVVVESTESVKNAVEEKQVMREDEIFISSEEGDIEFLITEDEEGDIEFLMTEDEEGDIGFLITEDEEPEEESGTEEEGNGLLSTEELNKKFDDFIKRMKEGIRIEAQQQLVSSHGIMITLEQE